MARGYPDYFGRSIWPKYGTGLVSDLSANILAGSSADVIDLALQGILTYFKVLVSGANQMADVILQLYLDGADICTLYFNDFADAPDVFTPRSLLCVMYRNEGPFKVICVNGVEIPFHTSLKVVVTNDSANVVTYTAICCYYVIT